MKKLELLIPGREKLMIENLILDYNGTLAVDGVILPGVSEKLISLTEMFDVYVVTADTFGSARDQLQDLPLQVLVIQKQDQAEQKWELLKKLGAQKTIAIGNGRNDIKMLEKAVIGIGIMQTEGCFSGITEKADLLYTNINDALDSLINPGRIIAALRN